MQDVEEHVRQQADEEFWEQKQRAQGSPKPIRRVEVPEPIFEQPASMKSALPFDGPSREIPRAAREEPRIDVAPPAVFRDTNDSKPASPKKRNTTTLWVLALAVLGALGYQGYRMLGKADALPEIAGASPLDLGFASASVLPSALPSAPIVSVVAAVPPAVAMPEPAGPTPEQIEINARLDRLEARLNEVIEGLRAQGYIIGDAGVGDTPLLSSSFAPHQATPPVSAAPARRIAVRRQRPAPPKPIAKAPEAPAQRHQLLSVDMWDGKASVVVGTGDAKNPNIKVMQPGDNYNGITLEAVDVGAKRATFSNGTRSVSMGVSN